MASTSPSDREPVIIGVADVVNRSGTPHEPLALISDAVQGALRDASSSSSSSSSDPSSLRSAVNELAVVKIWTWPYDDLPGLVAARTGLGKATTRNGEHGGHAPVKALDEACRKIVAGDEGVKVLAGGEALASLTACAKKGKLPPPGWTQTSTRVESVFSPTTRALGAENLGARHGIGNPVQVYPLYENGLRAARHQSRAANHAESARLYAEFARVAAGDEYAWSYGREPVTEEGIGRVDGRNRMICYPYPLLMNAFNNVDLAAAVVVTSVGTAKRLGVPKEKWVYVLGAAGTSDSNECMSPFPLQHSPLLTYPVWLRSSFNRSPALEHALDGALSTAGLTDADIALHDVYSCFPIVPKLAAQHLGLPISGALTLLGGLTSFGGAGNNYSMHALTEMTRRLRGARETQNGLVLANGGVLSYQHAAVLSSSPRKDGRSYPVRAVLDEHMAVSAPTVVEQADGQAVVETFTVEYDRSNAPKQGFVVGRLADGRRFVANTRGRETLRALVSDDGPEPIGRAGRVRYVADLGRNEFWFDEEETNRARL
ncbi:hypothetical protein ANO11243_063740 [Dothideomycetidae sp. 11243]|nr:hypothetical protein ANO11243_063740 [fungal sp. No.11243]